MASLIRIKRSPGVLAPTSLEIGELAYSYGPGTWNNGGDRLYFGSNNSIDVIGGKFFTERLDHREGIVLANSALVVDENKKLNELLVDNITIDGGAVTATTGDLTLEATGGDIIFNSPLNGVSLTLSGTLTADVNASSLTVNANETEVLFAGSGNEVTGNTNFTFDTTTGLVTVNGSLAVDNVTIDGNAISATGDLTLSPSGNIDAANNRITEVGTPTENTDATTKLYVDTADALKLNLSGGTMSGAIDMGTNSITGLAAPTQNTDAATKQYVDNATKEISISDGTTTDTVVTGEAITFVDAGDNNIVTAVSNNEVSFNLTTSGVTAGSYGDSNTIAAFTVDEFGRITSVSTSDVTTELRVSDGTDTDVVNLIDETLTIAGGTGVTSAVSNNQIELSIGQPVGTTDDVTFNNVTVNGQLNSDDITASTVTIFGNLTVTGNTTSVNTETINLADNIIVLNSNHDTGSAPTQDAGIEVKRGTEANALLRWDETYNLWVAGASTTTDGGNVVGGSDKIAADEFIGTIDGGTY